MVPIDNIQHAYIVAVSNATGIDPRVVISWMAQEGAFSGRETGQYNYLNIMGPNGRPISYNGVNGIRDAMLATIAAIRANHLSVAQTGYSHPTPRQQIAAIANSQWDGNDHYGGNNGQNLQSTYTSLFGNLDSPYVAPSQAAKIADETNNSGHTVYPGGPNYPAGSGLGKTIGGVAGDVTGTIGNIPHTVSSEFNSIAGVWKWIGGNWDRILFVIGGAILVIIALLLIVNSTKSNTFTFQRGDS